MMTLDQIKACMNDDALLSIEGLPFKKVATGKVREIYDTEDALLMITTDRVSAYDVVMPNGIPGKGTFLTQISLNWFRQTESLIKNHLVDNHDEALAELLKDHPKLISRSMLVKKLQPLEVEAIVRGYLSGSGWADYKKNGSVFWQDVPEGLVESDRLPEPLFTPTTKAQEGHDEAITLEQCREILGVEIYDKVYEVSMKLYKMGVEQAAKSGIIVADTKFEFGLDENNELYLIDEVLTPDSSRFWPADEYQPGKAQPSFDKQFVRDYLSGLDWDKTPPGPELPERVVLGTAERYFQAVEKLLG